METLISIKSCKPSFSHTWQSIAENLYITKKTDKWSDGAIHLGFNIARVFTLRKLKVSK